MHKSQGIKKGEEDSIYWVPTIFHPNAMFLIHFLSTIWGWFDYVNCSDEAIEIQQIVQAGKQQRWDLSLNLSDPKAPFDVP